MPTNNQRKPINHNGGTVRNPQPFTDPKVFASRLFLRQEDRARLYVTIAGRNAAVKAAWKAEQDRDRYVAVLTQIWTMGRDADPTQLVALAGTAVSHGAEHGSTVGRDLLGRHALRLREQVAELALERDMTRATATQEIAAVKADPGSKTFALGRWFEEHVVSNWPEMVPLIENGGWMTGPEVARARAGSSGLDVPSTVAGLNQAVKAGLIWHRVRGEDGVKEWSATKPRRVRSEEADAFLENMRRRAEAGDLSTVTDADLRDMIDGERIDA